LCANSMSFSGVMPARAAAAAAHAAHAAEAAAGTDKKEVQLKIANYAIKVLKL